MIVITFFLAFFFLAFRDIGVLNISSENYSNIVVGIWIWVYEYIFNLYTVNDVRGVLT